MRRRFQFSLRRLLGMAGAACVVFGGWHLFEQYGQFVRVSRAEVGERLETDCRFVLLSTEPVQLCRVNVLRDGGYVYHGELLAKSWVPFVYRLRCNPSNGLIRGGLTPGNYVVESYLHTRPHPVVSCKFTLPTK